MRLSQYVWPYVQSRTTRQIALSGAMAQLCHRASKVVPIGCSLIAGIGALGAYWRGSSTDTHEMEAGWPGMLTGLYSRRELPSSTWIVRYDALPRCADAKHRFAEDTGASNV